MVDPNDAPTLDPALANLFESIRGLTTRILPELPHELEDDYEVVFTTLIFSPSICSIINLSQFYLFSTYMCIIQGFDIEELTDFFVDVDLDPRDDVARDLGVSVVRAQTDQGE